MEDEFDMAYRAAILASLGWASTNIENDEDFYSDDKEYATMLETYGAARESEKRTNK